MYMVRSKVKICTHIYIYRERAFRLILFFPTRVPTVLSRPPQSDWQALMSCPSLLPGRQSEPIDVGCLFVDLEVTCETRAIY